MLTLKSFIGLWLALFADAYKNNWGLKFNGVDTFVRVPHDMPMNAQLIDSWTLEAWIKTSKVLKGSANKGTINIVGFPNRHPSLEITKSGKLSTQLRDESGQYYVAKGATTNINDGHWHHVAATWDNAELRMYVDGKVEGKVNYPRDENYNIAKVCDNGICEEGMQIGGYYCCSGKGYTGQFFNGTIDEVRVWNRAVSAAEIVKNKGIPLQAHDENGLIYYYPFDDIGMESPPNVVASLALDWYGILGNSNGTGKPTWVPSNAPLECSANSKAQACLPGSLGANTRKVTTVRTIGYTSGSMAAAVILTMICTAVLSAYVTHGTVTGKIDWGSFSGGPIRAGGYAGVSGQAASWTSSQPPRQPGQAPPSTSSAQPSSGDYGGL